MPEELMCMISWMMMNLAFLRERPIVLAFEEMPKDPRTAPQKRLKLEPFDVCIAYQAKVGMSNYSRVVMILAVYGDQVEVVPFSTKFELFDSYRHDFTVDAGQFGNKEDCFIVNKPMTISTAMITTKIGKMSGEVLQRFQKQCL